MLDNDYVRVSRDKFYGPADARAQCGHRVIVATTDIRVDSDKGVKALRRGDVSVIDENESLVGISESGYFEVVIKRQRPPAGRPKETIPAEKKALRFEGECFFVFEERLEPGHTRARHSHSHRVVIQLNRARLQQWPEGSSEVFVDTVPDKPLFNPPVIHTVKNVGDVPLRGVIIVIKPDCGQGPLL